MSKEVNTAGIQLVRAILLAAVLGMAAIALATERLDTRVMGLEETRRINQPKIDQVAVVLSRVDHIEEDISEIKDGMVKVVDMLIEMKGTN